MPECPRIQFPFDVFLGKGFPHRFGVFKKQPPIPVKKHNIASVLLQKGIQCLVLLIDTKRQQKDETRFPTLIQHGHSHGQNTAPVVHRQGVAHGKTPSGERLDKILLFPDRFGGHHMRLAVQHPGHARPVRAEQGHADIIFFQLVKQDKKREYFLRVPALYYRGEAQGLQPGFRASGERRLAGRQCLDRMQQLGALRGLFVIPLRPHAVSHDGEHQQTKGKHLSHDGSPRGKPPDQGGPHRLLRHTHKSFPPLSLLLFVIPASFFTTSPPTRQ